MEEEVSRRQYTMEELELARSVKKRSFGASWSWRTDFGEGEGAARGGESLVGEPCWHGEVSKPMSRERRTLSGVTASSGSESSKAEIGLSDVSRVDVVQKSHRKRRKQ